MSHAIKPIEACAQLTQFLAASDLPVADIAATGDQHFFARHIDGEMCAVVGLELYPPCALLRSLAVARALRGSGIGRELVAFAEREAAARGIDTLFLLTTSAAAFFATLGYANAGRAEAPATIQATAQFSGLCPASSHFMFKSLNKKNFS